MSGKYTEAEIAEFARRQGCPPEIFKMRWIIQSRGSYWVHGPKGYLPPVGMSDLPNVIRDHLIRAKNVPGGVRLTYKVKSKDTGEESETDRKIESILKDHATVAFKISASMSVPNTYLDAKEGTLVERVCPLRPIEPAYDANIDKWLRLFGGAKEEKLLDWVATAPQLDQPTCAIYAHGPKDTGKSLLALGLSRIWWRAPTEMRDYTDSFNSAIADCPLVFADEQLPPNVTSGDLRVMIGSSSHTLRRKGIPNATLSGCLRVIIAANTPDLIDRFEKEDFKKEDIAAIAARILYIQVDPAAAAFLESLGGASGGTKDWVTGDKIAAHALWLSQNRKVQHGKRFLVEGPVENFHRRLATTGRDRNLVIEWIVRALTHSWTAVIGDEYPHFRYGHGKIFVNASFISTKWKDIFEDDYHPPTTAKVARAITPISTGVEEKLNVVRAPKKPRHRVSFVEIDVDHVLRIAEEHQIAVREDIARIINRKRWNWEATEGEEEVFEEEARAHLSSVPLDTAPAPQAVTGAFADLAASGGDNNIGIFALLKNDNAPASRPARSLLDIPPALPPALP